MALCPNPPPCNSLPLYGIWINGLIATILTKESVLAWLLWLWDVRAETAVVNGPEISKLASITSHPALRQRLHTTVQHHEGNDSLMDWLMAACCITWPNKADVSVHTGLWSSMEDLQTYICELGMEEATYEEAFESLDLVKFSAGMRDLILQLAPSFQYGTLYWIPWWPQRPLCSRLLHWWPIWGRWSPWEQGAIILSS